MNYFLSIDQTGIPDFFDLQSGIHFPTPLLGLKNRIYTNSIVVYFFPHILSQDFFYKAEGYVKRIVQKSLIFFSSRA